ncbi:phage tail sheath family protein [Streptomyces yaizuensis]|uniref:Phage tail sheath subtilisin-like domain-containing protein n=1 Tax=Streptomyces yaizuensis TaxID=2989713 RepID=A0ABQ5NY23_9ACTN|nr:phage tail sheath C-terminal domain-containing protein [Streptomyces sp. YSPA8]GLF95280.1 phage tail sheath subtilisin-like domain-containing protein [Streptomyces sp. YSPA8]
MSSSAPPGVTVTEVPSGTRLIAGATTSVAAFVAARTPGVARYLQSWSDFTTYYPEAGVVKMARKDTYVSAAVAEAVYGFFLNGGSQCWIVPDGTKTSAEKSSSPPAAPAESPAEQPVSDGGSGETEGSTESSEAKEPTKPAKTTKPTGTKGTEDKSPPVDPAAAAVAQLEKLSDVSIVVTPDLTGGEPNQPYAAHCAAMGNRVLIVTLDQKATASKPVDLGSGRDYVAIYHPWIVGPGRSQASTPFPIAPGGHMAGIWARVDAQRGVFKAPANEPVNGAIALAQIVSDTTQVAFQSQGVNCLRVFPGTGPLVWGARTAADPSDSDNVYLNVRRLLCFLEESIRRATTWAVFEPNDDRLWASLRGTVGTFLTEQWRQGALMGQTPTQAFAITCDSTNNTPAVINAGQVVCDIAVAPVRPAEYVTFTVTQQAGGTATA